MDILPFSFLTLFQNSLIFSLFCPFLRIGKDGEGLQTTDYQWQRLKLPQGSNCDGFLTLFWSLEKAFELWYNSFGTILQSAANKSDHSSFQPCRIPKKGNKAVSFGQKNAEIRDSEGQSEPALQLLEISLGAIARGFESLSLRQIDRSSDELRS